MEVIAINIRSSSHFSYFKPGNLFVFFKSVPQWVSVEEVFFSAIWLRWWNGAMVLKIQVWFLQGQEFYGIDPGVR